MQDWIHPPFSGAVAGGYIWGRGTLDVKVGAVGLLEAATALLRDGFKPQRTLIFAFGQDEEVGGEKGAAEIAKLLTSRGVTLDMIWDEGSGIAADGINQWVKQPVALVSTAEKSYTTVHVALRSPGGHSSIPPIDGSSLSTRLGRLFSRIAAAPPPAKLVSPTKEFVLAQTTLVPVWLAPVFLGIKYSTAVAEAVANFLASMDNKSAAAVRTTAAVTNITVTNIADNVLPQSAEVGINFRLLPGELAVVVRELLVPGQFHMNHCGHVAHLADSQECNCRQLCMWGIHFKEVTYNSFLGLPVPYHTRACFILAPAADSPG